MPVIIITPMSIEELFSLALDQARRARDEIMALATTALADGESPSERALQVAPHAIALADAFTLVDQLANNRPTSPPQTTAPSEPQGCVPEDVN